MAGVVLPPLQKIDSPLSRQPQIIRKRRDSKLRALARRALAEEGLLRQMYTDLDGALKRTGIELDEMEKEAILIVGQRGAFLDEIEEELKETGISPQDIRTLSEFRAAIIGL